MHPRLPRCDEKFWKNKQNFAQNTAHSINLKHTPRKILQKRHVYKGKNIILWQVKFPVKPSFNMSVLRFAHVLCFVLGDGSKYLIRQMLAEPACLWDSFLEVRIRNGTEGGLADVQIMLLDSYLLTRRVSGLLCICCQWPDSLKKSPCLGMELVVSDWATHPWEWLWP